MTTDAVQTMIPTLDVTERPAPRPKVEAGVKLRGAEKVARIPVKIIPTTELPKKLLYQFKPMTTETPSSTAPAAPAYNASEKQKGASKTSRIPIKITPIEQIERLKKPDWIRVKAASANTRFYEIKEILRENKLVTVCEEASCPNIGECLSLIHI